MEGAGFAFNTTNMDFANAFTALPQQQQSFLKPAEGDTSADFFFGDEGIDTTASFIDPILFATPSQEPSYMTQSLTMDNTLGSTPVWNTQQLTPASHHLNSFPATPIQSFDVFQPAYGSSSLGKRPLQLDTQDFPQAKRHQSIQDYASLSSFPVSSTPSSSLDVSIGLSDEAADVCTTWFNKYAILPSDRHIDSLSQLTGESVECIRSWFGQLMKQGMGNSSDSAYKSQTDSIQSGSFWGEQFTADLAQEHQPQLALTQGPTEQQQPLAEEMVIPELTLGNDTTTTTMQPASALRGSKKRCTPTDNISLLNRDPNKIYQCTRKCGKRYGRKCDWKRNEEEGYPCKSWVCSLCKSEGVENVRPCFRKYHFVQHFRNIHPDINSDLYEESSIVCSETEFPRHCGFCKHRFDSRQERIDHIADHFKQGKSMLDWNDEESNGSSDSDNSDDDDDDNDNDKPSGDGFDGASDQSPDSNSSNNFDGKFYQDSGSSSGGSGGRGGSGSGSSLHQGGYFQFQLSELSGATKEAGIEHGLSLANTALQHPAPAVTEIPCSNAPHDLEKQQSSIIKKSISSSAASNTSTLARDVFTEPLIRQTSQPVCDSQTPVTGDPSWKQAEVTVNSTDAVQSVSVKQTKGIDVTVNSTDAVQPVSVKQTKGIDVLATQLLAGDPLPLPPSDLETKRAPDLDCRTVVLSRKVSSDASSKQTGESLLATATTMTQPFLSVKLLGAGGFSTVDEVLHRETNLRVGRKTLKNRSRTAAEELRKEVSVLQKLRHPHVIRFLGAYSKGDKMSILLSPVAETTLALWLEKAALQRPTNLTATVLKMFGCLVSSVRYLHEQRPVVIHMDIKPQNILITHGDDESPHVVLSDFGTSSSDDADDKHKPLTRRYIAPEVFEGFNRKQAADIWSLGCVFLEMCAISFSDSNDKWLEFGREYSGRTGKHYWQDVAGLQSNLTSFLASATTETEQTVVSELRAMLHPEPASRPDAATLCLKFLPSPCCLNWPNDQAIFPGPSEELSSAEMHLHDEADECRDQIHTTDRRLLDHAKQWLKECECSHDACQHAIKAKQLPTRLIDLSPEENPGTVRIVSGASLPASTEYVALSHAWSANTPTYPIRLTTARLASMQSGIAHDQLPTALQPATLTATSLGFRYLYLDALCVLQDSITDKQAECVAMASVYRNAALTIVLDDVDCTADFSTPWNTVAWARQERLLSRRFLHLGHEQMYWECNTLKASETFPRGLQPLVWEKVHSRYSNAPVVAVAGIKNDTQTLRSGCRCDAFAPAANLPSPGGDSRCISSGSSRGRNGGGSGSRSRRNSNSNGNATANGRIAGIE